MRLWKFLSSAESGLPRMNSSPPKNEMMSRQWKEKRLGNDSRLLETFTGPDGVWVTRYRYTGLFRAAAGRERVNMVSLKEQFT